MAADVPTILATSGGLRPGRRTDLEFGPLMTHAVELAGVQGRAPRLCTLGTATGDQRHWAGQLSEAGRVAGVELSVLHLFPMPSVDDVEAQLLAQDVVWVGGGSVVNLLAVWRAHALDVVFERAWRAGVVLSGVSAGSLCWHVGGTTDSFGPQLRPITDALGLLPYGNAPHYDSDPQRRPLTHRLVAEGTLPTSYCADDGVGLHYRGTDLVEAVTDRPGQAAYRVTRQAGGTVVEDRIEPRPLPVPRTG
ncbi:MAG: peptidase E [Pseudonocardiaceae bacterium]|nr:peptidase E [Pseudonocardiaceae bacterium]